MFLVATALRPSKIHGIGVFLLEPVKKGGVVWRFDSRIDRVVCKNELDGLPAAAREFVALYAPWNKETNLWMLYGDNAKYCNHSPDPTLVVTGNAFTEDVAARDLQIGDELTSDYDDCYDNKDLLQKMNLR